jgi:hypothetical protein
VSIYQGKQQRDFTCPPFQTQISALIMYKRLMLQLAIQTGHLNQLNQQQWKRKRKK